MTVIAATPVKPPKPDAGRSARAQLRQAVWEASQFFLPHEIDKYVDEVLEEIKSDEP